MHLFRAIGQQFFLKELDISRNEIGMNMNVNKRFEQQNPKYLCYSLEYGLPASLETVCFDECSLSDMECEYIAYALKTRNHIQNLSLRQNCITSEGLDYICSALCSPSCQVDQLDVSDNQINDNCEERLLVAL